MVDQGGAWIIGGAALIATEAAVRRWAQRRSSPDVARAIGGLGWPLRTWFVLVLIGILAANRWWPLGDEVPWIEPLARVGSVLSFAWLLARALSVAQSLIFRRLRIDVDDNRRARSRRTQLELGRRMLTIFLWVTAAVVAALTFEAVRRLGPALVAYAGIIGVLVGVALRAPLENLMSGLMVATIEPVRIDDVVVVEGELGHVEEIGLSQVVVRLWDRRRLILPTSHFVNGTFENWTRHYTDLIGVVTVAVDHRVDVHQAREELGRIVRVSPQWDGSTCVLEVTEIGERSVELRALVSAGSASELWDLRCHVRERLLLHLRSHQALPRVRTEVAVDAGTTEAQLTADQMGGGRREKFDR